jgi:ParB family chromosome partitioning protein
MIVDTIAAVRPKDDPMDWTPDDTFFDPLRGKRVINAMLSEIAGEACAKAAVKQTGKDQKEAIRNHMAGKGVLKAQPDWMPRWMRFPAISYLSNEGCQPATNAAKVDALMDPPSQGSSRSD